MYEVQDKFRPMGWGWFCVSFLFVLFIKTIYVKQSNYDAHYLTNDAPYLTPEAYYLTHEANYLTHDGHEAIYLTHEAKTSAWPNLTSPY